MSIILRSTKDRASRCLYEGDLHYIFFENIWSIIRDRTCKKIKGREINIFYPVDYLGELCGGNLSSSSCSIASIPTVIAVAVAP